jgi:(p)ppGpp synthase/HD superfamily hydrolase
MATLEQAIAIAVKSHSGQVDKAGEPYILHPLRVMFSLNTESERIAGVLHDVVEDSQVSIEDLIACGFSKEVIDAIKAVTKRPEEENSDEGYQNFVARAAANPIARRVKIADLRDNMDVTRLGDISDKDARRLGKYLRSLNYLESMEK